MTFKQNQSGLTVFPSHTCLITRLAQELMSQLDPQNPHKILQTVVILPTQRLSNQLAALLSSQTATFLPQIYNLDRFIETYAQPVPEQIIDDVTFEFLVANIIKDSNLEYIQVGHAHEACQLFHEFTDHLIMQEAFDSLEAAIEDFSALSDARLDSLFGRAEELKTIFGLIDDYFEANNLHTLRQSKVDKSLKLAAQLEDDSQWSSFAFDKIYMMGFTSHVTRDEAVLRALAQSDQSHCWVSQLPVPQAATIHPMENFCKLWSDKPVQNLTADHSSTCARHRLVNRVCGTPLEETAAVLTIVSKMIEGGYKPSGIGILVADDALYGPHLRTFLKFCDFGYNAAITTPLSDSLVGRWVESLFGLLLGSRNPEKILSYISHPIVVEAMRADFLEASLADTPEQAAVQSYQLNTKMGAFLANQPASFGFAELIAHADDDIRGSLKFLQESFTAIDKLLLKEATIVEWLGTIAEYKNQMFSHLDLQKLGHEDFHINSAAFKQFDIHLAKCCEANLTQTLFRSSEVLPLIKSKLSSLDIRDVGDQLKGVQILSIEEARYVPFQTVFILGCAEGMFPKALPKDNILDNLLKSKIGLPGWQYMEAIEASTFNLLYARLPSLQTSYPLHFEGKIGVKSHFVEKEIVFGNADELKIDSAKFAFSFLADKGRKPHLLDLNRRTPIKGTYDTADVDSMLYPISATSLESLIDCPYKFLMKKLKVTPLDFAKENDARLEGEILHQILEIFHSGRHEDKEVFEPFAFETPWESMNLYATNRLIAITDKFAPQALVEGPLGLHLKTKSWPEYANFIVTIYTPDTIKLVSKGLREFKFPKDSFVNGRIDAVETLADSQSPVYMICDYKRKNMPNNSQVKSGSKPQLLLYAQGLSQLEGEYHRDIGKCIVGYFSIIEAKWNGIAAGSEVINYAKEIGLVSARQKEVLEDYITSMDAISSWRHESLSKDQGFRADSSIDKTCQYCDFGGLCRRNHEDLELPVSSGGTLKAYLALDGSKK